MKRINITFSHETYERLKQRRISKGEKSVAPSVRALVDLGFKIEDAARKNQDQNSDNDIEKLIKLMKKNMEWSLETRLLMRFIVENLPGGEKQKLIEKLEQYKESALHYMKGLLDESIK